ncbi:MAG: dTDP-glucose 4,6-dehydratase [Candidatus Methylomirabilales bacterium]
MRTILITGGAGFIGSNFAAHLYGQYPDYRLLILDNLTYAASIENLPARRGDERLVFWYGNVRNAELVDSLVAQSDAVVHLAAETHVTRSIYDNRLFFETDVLGTQVVANTIAKYQDRVERFLHISTSEVYGTAQGPVMDEEHPLVPRSPYAAAKVGADRLVHSYWITYGIPAVILRPFNNYGPRQHLEKVIPRFITSCLLGEPLTVHGSGESQRDWVFIEDTCEALDAALHADIGRLQGEAINLGTGRSISIRAIAEMVADRMGTPRSQIQHVGERPGQVVRHISSTEKAAGLLGWRARMSFEVGLGKTIEWYRANRPWWERQLWMRQVPIVTRDGRVELH